MAFIFLMLIPIFLIILAHALYYYSSSYYMATNRLFFQILSDKGAFGEYLIYKKLRSYEKLGARFLFNCYLPKNNSETSEIDVLMIFRSGIYVFESKNYGGWIFGSESSRTWTQTLPNGRGSRKEYFYNPIMQNKVHIKWLQKQIDGTCPVHSIIAFSDRCEFKNINVNSLDVIVTHRSYVTNFVNIIDSKTGLILDEDKIDCIFQQLYPYTQVSQAVKDKHINDIASKNADVSNNIKCPKCGGTLVLRTARRGANAGNHFYGCSNYPRCHYMGRIN